MRMLAAATLLIVPALAATPAAAGPAEEVEALYERFVVAQNHRDLAAVRALLWDSPSFLWISDGKPFWGRDALVERMAGFQTAEVWRVEPDRGAAVPVVLDDDSAYLHLPLTLVIGNADAPDRLRWLVAMLAQRTEAGWAIAALFTTADRRPDAEPGR